MNPSDAELRRYVANAFELRRRVAAILEEIDYMERTGASPGLQKSAWHSRLASVADGLDEHYNGLESLLEK